MGEMTGSFGRFIGPVTAGVTGRDNSTLPNDGTVAVVEAYPVYAHGTVVSLQDELNHPGKISATDISKRAHRKLLAAGVKVKYRVEHKIRRGR